MKYLKNYNTFILESSFYNSDYSNMKLTTLIGLDIPDFVDNYFWCFGNQLISLEGSPINVMLKELKNYFHIFLIWMS